MFLLRIGNFVVTAEQLPEPTTKPGTGLIEQLDLPPAPDPPPAEPRPIVTLVARGFRSDGGKTISVISRTWAPHDSRRCRLCPVCSAVPAGAGTVCLIMVEQAVSDRAAPRFSAHGLTVLPQGK
jgi:hypothetical protein